jgi:glycosyltransferase involved in cell wall biosynthesis
MPSRKKKLLLLWSSYDFAHIYQTAFADHPDFEIELVSAEGLPRQQAGYRRLLHLRKQVDEGKFDLVVANNINRSPFPGNKGWATTASLAARLFTYQRRRLDSWWAPWMVRYGKSQTPLAAVDSRDGHYVFPWDLPLLAAARLYFKKDLMYWPRRALMPLQNSYTEKKIKPYEAKLRPMSLGLEENRFVPVARPMKDRDIDLFLSGNENNPLRRLIREKCEALSGRYRVQVHTKMLPFEEYHEALQRAKLVVCVESFGGETWRQYEVAAAGAVPLMSWPYTQVHDPLLPDKHAFYFSYMNDHFERTVDEALRDGGRLQRMSDAARQFVLAKKGRRGLLNYVVETTLAPSS